MNDICFNNLDDCKSFSELKRSTKIVDLKSALSPERVNRNAIPAGGGLTYNYAAKLVGDRMINVLQNLADEQQLATKYLALASGEAMNTGENRKVLHHLMRGQLGPDVFSGGRNLRDFYSSEHKRVYQFAQKVHEGRILGSTGRPFKSVVQIGIGGSDLGPRALYLALENYARENDSEKMKALFISNVDPDDAN